MQAEVWLLELDETPGAAFPAGLDTTVLDARERERAAAFVRPADRTLYTAAHIALRTVLGGLLGERPGDLAFTREPCPCCGLAHGRPALAVPGGDLSVPPPLHFSLSHTRGMVLIATAPVPVGADVELRPAPETVADVLSVLHPRERADVEAEEEPGRRAAAFGRIWARKEAYLKGLGTGLGRAAHLDDLGGDGDVGDGGEGGHGRHPEGWTVYDLPCGPAHHAAVALRSPRATTRPPALHHLSPEALGDGAVRGGAVPGGAVPGVAVPGGAAPSRA
ncbi:4'-phosphopantetheinyl transferase superfamily protein [Streptomyces sp. NPDC126499]|uniref:4'-phosphopantetheinyl transferase family protein n=1 Tax=Streptomyces sp. NPDC126499 TaxID=3155314 RepID=UPI00332EE58A